MKLMLALAGTVATAQAQDAAQTPAGDSQSKLPKLDFFGDARYRYEIIDGLAPSFDRQRVRARLGVDAEVTPSTHGVFKLSTGGGDPRSAHITLSNGYSRKEIGVDLAYLEWKPNAALAVSAGKIPYPTWRPAQSLFIGGDFNPEGIALGFADGSGIFMSGYSFWLDDHSTTQDAKHNGAQLGYGAKASAGEWGVAVSYNDLSHVQGAMPFLDRTSAFGNSVNPDGSFASGFQIVDLSAQWIHEGRTGSLTVFAHAAHNSRAARGADAYAGGAQFSSKLLSRDFSVSYQYARIGKDSLFGQFMDGDFGGGVTDSRGHVFRLSSETSARTRATLSYFDNEVGQAQERYSFQLIQLDVDLLF